MKTLMNVLQHVDRLAWDNVRVERTPLKAERQIVVRATRLQRDLAI